MTAQPNSPTDHRDRVISLLEAILDKVETIDDTVDAILDRLGEYAEYGRYFGDWTETLDDDCLD